jgi:hypothetical protein
MSIVVTYSSVKLSKYLSFLQMTYLMSQTVGKVGILLAKSGWRGRLTVSVSQHRLPSPSLTFVKQGVKQTRHGRKDSGLEGVSKHESVSEIVDVFASATEMNPLFVERKLIFEVVLH